MLPRSVAAFIVLLSTLVLFGACNGQGEGEVCDPRNGNGDCRNGYLCRSTLLGPDHGYRCCPGDTALVTTVACGLNQGASTDASTAAPDDGAADGDADASNSDVAADSTGADGPDGSTIDGASPDGADGAASPGDGAIDGD